MKKSLVIFFILVMGNFAFAHDLWVKAKNNESLQAQIIYGHKFPNPEKIPKEREILFEPVKIISENGEITLTQAEEFYTYFAKDSLKSGTYIVKAKYKETPWIEKMDGKWEMNKTRKDTQDEVKKCGIYSMLAKSIIVVGESDDNFISKPLGKGFEITPLAKYSDLKKDATIKFKVTKDGKPVKIIDVYGSLEGYSENEMSMAFYAKTDLKGEFIFKPLKSGFWYLKADYNQDSNNKDCELIGDKTTISFEVK